MLNGYSEIYGTANAKICVCKKASLQEKKEFCVLPVPLTSCVTHMNITLHKEEYHSLMSMVYGSHYNLIMLI